MFKKNSESQHKNRAYYYGWNPSLLAVTDGVDTTVCIRFLGRKHTIAPHSTKESVF